MSDYGDDYSDYGDEFYYVEDEYMVADDLAEHAVGSPPPTAYDDEDALLDWDRFDYFNDLEYASDGYDDANFTPHDAKSAKTGEKRKRTGTGSRGKKKQKVTEGHRTHRTDSAVSELPPVVWRAQTDRDPKTKMWDESTESYAVLKDWRERPADIPVWAAGTPSSEFDEDTGSRTGKMKAAFTAEPISPASDDNGGDHDEEEAEIDPTVLMAALQNQLSAAGGPLAGMDPQQLLQFAMRMMSNKDDGDDIAGEMADQLLNQGKHEKDEEEDEEEDEDDSTELLSWLDKQRKANHDGSSRSAPAAAPKSLESNLQDTRPPTPPSSESNQIIRAPKGTKDHTKGDGATVVKQNSFSLEVQKVSTRKRKVDDDVAGVENSLDAPKRRATRSYDAPTAASQARAAPTAKATRSGQAKRP